MENEDYETNFCTNKCTQCLTDHKLLEGSVPSFERYDILPYSCVSCKQFSVGNRLICGDCLSDICYKCAGTEETAEHIELPMVKPVHYARIYLNRVSLRERQQGIPVGVLLVSRVVAGSLRNEWTLNNFDTMFGKLGYKKVIELPGDPEYFVMHLSTFCVKYFIIESRVLSQKERALEQFMYRLKLEFYPGIRLYDPMVGQPLLDVEEASSHLRSSFPHDIPQRFTYVELFSGVGGFRLGLDLLGGQCIFASEIDSKARETYSNNFGSKTRLTGDISELYAYQIPVGFDLLTAGFPCQPFSARGEQKGLNDSRGQLFRELVRVLKCCQPRSFLFENVPSLVTMDGGKRIKSEPVSSIQIGETFATILRSFEESGYRVTWNIINSRHWLPQMRERVYIIGFRNDMGITSDIDWLLGRRDLHSSPGLQSKVLDIMEPPDSEATIEATLTAAQWDSINSPEFILKANRRSQSSSEGSNKERWILIDGKAPTIISNYRNSHSFSSKYIFQERDGSIRDIPRFLTPRECSRAMGFPDSFMLPACSQHAYQQIGNAVCPPVIAAIGEQILLRLRPIISL